VLGLRRCVPVLAATALAAGLSACGPQPGAGSQPPGTPRTSTAPTASPDPTAGTQPTAGTAPATCPGSGLAVSAGPVDAALGLRAVTLTVLNCGSAPATVEGYPALRLLDEQRTVLEVSVEQQPDPVGNDPGVPITPVTLAPGGTAQAVVLWRNTVEVAEDVAPGSYLAVTAAPGDEEQAVPVVVDLGSTARLVLGPWRPPA
jgi:hypothetical protein